MHQQLAPFEKHGELSSDRCERLKQFIKKELIEEKKEKVLTFANIGGAGRNRILIKLEHKVEFL